MTMTAKELELELNKWRGVPMFPRGWVREHLPPSERRFLDDQPQFVWPDPWPADFDESREVYS